MKLLIDDAHIEDIKRIYEYYPVDGVTTNPSILNEAGKNPKDTLSEIRDFIGKDGLLFAQAVAPSADGMVEDARAIVRCLGSNTIVKIPSTREGFKAIRKLRQEGIHTCGTVVYTPLQAYLAGKAGADYVAPYVNRIDNMGYNGIGAVKEIQDILTDNGMETQVLAASFKNSEQVLELAEYGVGAATCAPSVIDSFVNNAAIDNAIADFTRDFFHLTHEGCTMAELL